MQSGRQKKPTMSNPFERFSLRREEEVKEEEVKEEEEEEGSEMVAIAWNVK